jgi:hypothetical protein
MIKRKLINVFFIAICTLSVCAVSHAQPLDDSAWQLSGFGTLALSHSDNDNLGARNTTAQDGYYDEWNWSQYSRLGLQIDYAHSERVSAGLQIVAKKRDFDDSLSDLIHWAYVDFTINPSFAIRLGRVAQDNYLVSEYREVGYAQPWAHTPFEYYGQLSSSFRNGIQLRFNRLVNEGLFSARLALSKGDLGTVNNGSEDILDFEPNYDFTLEWENLNWRVQFNHNRGKISTSDDDVVALQDALRTLAAFGWTSITPFIDDFNLNDTTIKYYSAGVSYQNNGWLIQSELSYTDTESAIYDNVRNGYFLVGKRLGNWTPFILYAQAKSDRFIVPEAPVFLAASQAELQVGTDFLGTNQKTISVGTRWDVATDIALKMQWDITRVKAGGAFLYDIIEPHTDDETVHQFTMALDLVF